MITEISSKFLSLTFMQNFLSINDLSRDEALALLADAARLKTEYRNTPELQLQYLPGQTLAMIFEKPSLRTRVSFDAAMRHCGGGAIYLAPGDIGLGKRESIADVARVLSGMTQAIMARVFEHQTLFELAKWSSVPVINALCDIEHPCQALADLQTLAEEGHGLEGRKLAYVGDGNNVCHSLMLLCAKVGVRFRAATPPGYEPDANIVKQARAIGDVEITTDPFEAVQNADAIYTDVWTSMGQEEESARRLQVFPPYQINQKLMDAAAADVILLHCLPAHRGEEVTADVFEGARSRVFAQAENRLHAQKAVLLNLMARS